MSTLQDLAALQDIEDSLDRGLARLKEIRKLYLDPPEVLAAREEANAAAEVLDSLRRQLRDLEVEATAVRNKREAGQKRLYGGEVTNTRELSGLEAEAEALARRLSQLEDQMLDLMLEADEAGQLYEVKNARQASLEAGHAESVRHLKIEEADLMAEVSVRRGEIEQMRRGLPADLLGRYDALKGRKGGKAVARVRRGTCAACGVQLPTHVVQKARQGEELTCTSCGRLLCPN